MTKIYYAGQINYSSIKQIKNKTMKKQLIITGLLSVMLFFLSCSPQGEKTSKDKTKSQNTTVTVETLKQILAAFNRHDLDGIMAFFTDDCSFDFPKGPDPWGQRFTGKAQVREAIASRFKGIPDVQYSDSSEWVAGDRGVSEWLLTGTRTSGESVNVRICVLWEFQDGKVKRMDTYWKIVEPSSTK
jgi:ketosteroid isomerase-like protein